MKKRLLLQHKKDYKKLNKAELIAIIEDELQLQKLKNSRNVYNPLNSIRNNARRAIKRLWGKRGDIVTRARIRKHINTLKGFRND